MIIKILGCLTIIFCGCLLGVMYTGNMKARIRELESINYMAEYLLAHIKYDNRTLKELFDDMSKVEKLNKTKFIPLCSHYMEKGYNFPIAFEKSISDSKKDLHLHIDDINTVLNLKNDLGTTYIDGQIKTLTLFEMRLNERLDESKEKYKIEAPMYQKLCALVGIGISILLF